MVSCILLEISVKEYDFCQWLADLGGPSALGAYDIMQLVSAYSNVIDLKFTVTAILIMAAVAYYSGYIENGNNLSGCSFEV